MDKHFDRLRESIIDQLYRAREHLDILRTLNESTGELREIRYRYVTFFFFTMYAHSDRFCLSIYNLTKHLRKTSNIERLLRYIQSSKELSSIFSEKEISQFRNRILEQEDTIKRIIGLRDKQIAHNELGQESFPKLDYYKKGGKELVAELCNIINEISAKYDGRTFDFEILPTNTTYYLLSELSECNEKAMRELEETKDDLT